MLEKSKNLTEFNKENHNFEIVKLKMHISKLKAEDYNNFRKTWAMHLLSGIFVALALFRPISAASVRVSFVFPGRCRRKHGN